MPVSKEKVESTGKETIDKAIELALSYSRSEAFIIEEFSESQGFSPVPFGDGKAGQVYKFEIELDLVGVIPGSYYIGCEFHEIDSAGANEWHDYIQNMLQAEILENQQIKLGVADHTNKIPWNHNMWGSIRMASQITENIVEDGARVLSIIIPIYNDEKHLAECLDSCLQQNIPSDDYK